VTAASRLTDCVEGPPPDVKVAVALIEFGGDVGFQLAASETEADLLIYNTCAVKGPTENRIIDDLKHAPKNKKIVVAGCLPKISFERLLREVHFDGAVGPAVGGEIVDVVRRVLAGGNVVDLAAVKEKPLLGLQANINPA
jgi:tRNA A37 methylthiotransferase MiaB